MPGAKAAISVITIVKNDAAGLRQTIDSVRAQRFADYEHVVVDGGSTDATPDVIRAHDGHLARWVSEPDDGIADAFNSGITLARGEWINFLNAGDTFVDADVLGLVAQHLSRAAIVTGYSVTGATRSPPYRIENHEYLPRRAWISHQASFVHRRVFDACGGFDVRFRVRMDYEFWLRVLPRFPFEFVDADLVNFASGGVSARRQREFFEEEYAANRMHLRFARLANARVWARRGLQRLLRSLHLFDAYRRWRLPPRP